MRKRKGTLRKSSSQVHKNNHQDTHFQVDLVSLTKKKERILGTKAILVEYYLVIEEVMMMIVVVAVKKRT